jgi:Fe2+ transport system protein FeoA
VDRVDLYRVPAGGSVRLTGMAVAGPMRRRLLELGFVPGQILRVLGRGATGGLLLAVGDSRIAVDRQVCAALKVASEHVAA